MSLESQDLISGKQGTAFITKDGQIRELAELKNIEAKIELSKADVKILGKRGTGHKITGWNGTGTMNIYYVTSYFREMAVNYIKTGKVSYFDIQVKNEDEASAFGKQTTALKKCLIDSAVIAKLDNDADYLDEEVPFTFEDADILDKFTEI